MALTGLIGFLGSILLLAPSPAQSQTSPSIPTFATGNEILASCSNEDSNFFFACVAYLQGYTHGVYAGTFQARGTLPYCVPDGVTNQQTIDIVVQGLRAVPASRHLAGNVLLMLIFQRAFPCPARNSN